MTCVATKEELEQQAEELSRRELGVSYPERVERGELNSLSGTIVEIRLRMLKHMLDTGQTHDFGLVRVASYSEED